MRAIMTDRARLQRMLDFEAALARAEAAVGVVTATGAVVIGEACDASRYDIDALVAGASALRQHRHRRGRRADQGGRRPRSGGGELRALGRHQPGRHRHRADAGASRRDRCADRRPRPRHQGLRGVGRPPPPHPFGRPHLAAAGAADAVRAEACRLCRGAGALARAADPASPRGAGAAVRRRRRHARGARRARLRRGRTARGAAQSARCPTRRGTATATGWPRSPPASASSPAPAARSPAMSR